MSTWATRRQMMIAGMMGAICATLRGQDDGAKAAVDSVLKLYDAAEYGQLYDTRFHDSMKQQMTREQWIAAARQIARQTGKVVNRTVAKQAKSMGIVRFIFNTQCAEGKVWEDLSVQRDGEDWKVIGFWVRPNLE